MAMASLQPRQCFFDKFLKLKDYVSLEKSIIVRLGIVYQVLRFMCAFKQYKLTSEDTRKTCGWNDEQCGNIVML